MHKSLVAWLATFWIAIMIHVDWHLGRPGHDHLSFGLPYHWLSGVATFGPLPWVLVRRWRTSFAAASAFVIMVGAVLGQGLEPLSEALPFNGGLEPFMNTGRWRIFGGFVAAGILSYVAATVVVLRSSRHAAA
jgi:hypothetical protein